ncbi:hypothetical protein WS66_16065 [Burkholderia sp. LA-2-3-30-S1-D2]|nr:hypothetical protein WS66_16065 [Burkholderia sp. LA-2-3-30-S1-D2]KVE14568.1 hypothetical protein WS66_12195 [Burkholderia sp. LA-2-3-30-S1-D2]
MDNKPIPGGIGKAAIFVERPFLADQSFRFSKVSLHCTAFANDSRENKRTPRMGAEFFLHVGWSTIGHMLTNLIYLNAVSRLPPLNRRRISPARIFQATTVGSRQCGLHGTLKVDYVSPFSWPICDFGVARLVLDGSGAQYGTIRLRGDAIFH